MREWKRSLGRIVFSIVFAAVVLAFVGTAFSAPPCPCAQGGECVCPAGQCGCGSASLYQVALLAEGTKSVAAQPAACPPQTYHYEKRCNGRQCFQVLCPDTPPAAVGGATAGDIILGPTPTVVPVTVPPGLFSGRQQGGCATCPQTGEPPLATFGVGVQVSTKLFDGMRERRAERHAARAQRRGK